MKKIYLTLAVAGTLLLAVLGLARCNDSAPPAPLPVASPMPAATAIASSSTAATLTNDLEIVIPPRRVAQNPYTAVQTRPAEPKTQQPRGMVVGDFPKGSYSVEQEEPIIIRIKQTATAAASSEASASVDHLGCVTEVVPDHARLGVISATMPGILAADYQLLRLDASPLSRPALGLDLELGLDVAANVQVGALGVTAGGKAFAGAWAWSRWDLGAQGLAAGVGLRF